RTKILVGSRRATAGGRGSGKTVPLAGHVPWGLRHDLAARDAGGRRAGATGPFRPPLPRIRDDVCGPCCRGTEQRSLRLAALLQGPDWSPPPGSAARPQRGIDRGRPRTCEGPLLHLVRGPGVRV